MKRVLLLCLLLCPSLVLGEVVGVVTSVGGPVDVQRGDTTLLVESPGFPIRVGDVLQVGPAGACGVMLGTGESFQLTANMSFVVPQPQSARLIGRVTRFFGQLKDDFSGRPHPAPMLSRNVEDLLREPLEAIQLVFPSANGAVRSSNPVFVWRSVPQLDRVTVLVIAEDRGLQTQLVGSNQHVLFWPGLTAGASHAWQIKAMLNGVTVETSFRDFEVIAEQEEHLLDQALQSLDSLERGILLFAAGLHAEALTHLEAAAATPATSEHGSIWLARLLDRCGIRSVTEISSQ
jgi:hypothetical protein